jgi:hypothetical protein
MQSLTIQESEQTCGGLGIIESILVGVAVTCAGAIINNWDSFKAGLMGEPDPAAKKAAQ